MVSFLISKLRERVCVERGKNDSVRRSQKHRDRERWSDRRNEWVTTMKTNRENKQEKKFKKSRIKAEKFFRKIGISIAYANNWFDLLKIYET